MSDITHKVQRPTSPHLQVYKLPLTALISIFHRMTGAGLSVGMILVAGFLFAAASGEKYYDMVMGFAISPLGLVILALWSFALYFHMFNGIRHMIWDTGRCLSKEASTRGNYIIIISSLLVTAATWAFACPLLYK